MSKALTILGTFILGCILLMGASYFIDAQKSGVILVPSKPAQEKINPSIVTVNYDDIEEGVTHHLKVTTTRERVNTWETSVPKNNREAQIIKKTKRISFD